MNETEFDARVRALTPRLYRVSGTLLSCEADREDAAQEAVIKAWRSLRALREERYFETWVIRILINECRRIGRKRRPGPLPEEIRADEPSETGLADALKSLDVKYRLPVTLHYVEGYPLADIARMLNIPLGTVKRRLFTARGRLRDALEGGDGA
jgi:RNA polymerase sigma-70 factor (ECF subfamily)